MKIKEGLVAREVLGKLVVVPTGEASREFQGMIKLNKTGGDIWRGIEEGCSVEEIAARLVEKYRGVDMDTARSCVNDLIAQMREAGFLEG